MASDISAGSDRSLPFPLRLSYIERYFLTDHTPDYPMTSVIFAELDGELQRDPFEAAWHEARQRHPMVHATARYHWLTLAGVWNDAGDLPPPITWCDTPPVNESEVTEAGDGTDDAPAGLGICDPIRLTPWGWIDLLHEPGVRAWVHQWNGRSRVTFLVHHACIDGVGILEFMGDLFAAYGMRTAALGAVRPRYTQEYDHKILRQREDFLVPRLKREGLLYTLKVMPPWVWEGCAFVLRRTLALGGDRPAMERPRAERSRSDMDSGEEAVIDPDLPQLHFFELDAERMRRVDSLFDPSLFSLNDLMLRDMALTLWDWNERYPSRHARDPLRLDMPMNLRTPDTEGLSAANCVSHTFLKPSPQLRERPAELLAEIMHLTRRMVYHRAGMMFNSWLRTGFCMPGMTQLMENVGKNYATTVLSNAGNAIRAFGAKFPLTHGQATAGDVRIRRITGVPPVRRGTPAVFCMTRNYRRFSMLVRTDPRIFTREGGDELTRMYRQRLCDSIDSILADGVEAAITKQ